MLVLKEPSKHDNPLLAYVYRTQQQNFQVIADEITLLERDGNLEVGCLLKKFFFFKIMMC
jgi:hypothetical protein